MFSGRLVLNDAGNDHDDEKKLCKEKRVVSIYSEFSYVYMCICL